MQTNNLNKLEFDEEVVSTIRFLSRIIESKITDNFLIGSAIVYRRQLKEYLNGVEITQIDESV
jgi:hypothetical protein